MQFAVHEIGKAVASMEDDPVQRENRIVVVFNGWDVDSVAIYEEIAHLPGSTLPKRLEPGELTVVGCAYDALLHLLEQHYDLSEFENPPLEPKQVRLLLFAAGSIAFRRVERHSVSIPPGLMRGKGGVA